MRNETEIQAIPFKCISPIFLDVSPMDYGVFEFLKQTLYKRHSKTLDGLWKIVVEEWIKINLDILRKAFLSWKSRYNIIYI